MAKTLILSFLKTSFNKIIFLVFFVIILSSITYDKKAQASFDNLDIVSSIAPIHSIVKQILTGTEHNANLLISGNQSVHGYQLKPSQISLMNNADRVYFVATYLESSLAKLHTQDTNKYVELSDIDNIKLLKQREEHIFELEEDEHGHDDEHGHSHEDDHDHNNGINIDPHIWLDIDNVIAIATFISNDMIALDSINKAIYEKNLTNIIDNLQSLDKQLLNSAKDLPSSKVVVFHDAYQYFENQYSIQVLGSMSINPEVPISPRKFVQIKEAIREDDVSCILSEVQFSNVNAQNISKELNLKTFSIDPIGGQFFDEQNPDKFYDSLLNELLSAFIQC